MLYYPKSHGHKENASYDPFASHSAPAQEKVTNFEKKLFSNLKRDLNKEKLFKANFPIFN